ncbi:putative N-acetylneuraminate transporter [Caenispirillum salinarum AK4]|uniref:TRAP transporter small permease protein n=1 Tax=Caenispirillum salinarum AK4 TaxID=1238182 RepID=K9GTV1_9PROT|nr:TRAP transporter small permease [Caenispirillum salinarum]EKV28144.1 putative N-acetylneuraminate transporter [Caenispirillum salinarum AK4]
MSDTPPSSSGGGGVDDKALYGPQGPADADPPPPPKVPLKVEEALAALAMALICVISLANVVVRYATNASFAFTEEFSVFLLVVMTLLGAAVAFARHDHIKITFFLERMPKPLRLAAELLTLAITTLVFSMVLYYGALFAWDEFTYETVSAGLGYPNWLYTMWLPILSAVILFRVLERAWLALRPRRNRDGGRGA